jgi:hypothetical protein
MRQALLACAALVSLVLVACGDKSATLKVASGSTSLFSLVITGSADTIATLENKESSYWASMKTIAGASTTTADGDQHAGRFVCQTDVTDNGVQYHVAVYGTVAGTVPEICSQIQRSIAG